MVQSSATTVPQYLAELPSDRRAVVAAVRKVIQKHLPKGYRETIRWGMISYEIPLKNYPDTYNGQPLSFAGLAAQKNHFSLYLSCAYADPERKQRLERAFAEAGKKFDAGKSCIRFKTLDDLALEAIGQIIADTPPQQFIELYEQSRSRRVGPTK